jgi:hypothetical protein
MRRPAATAKAAIFLGFITGSWMIVDGAHRLITGDFVRYRGELGPWATLIRGIGWDPMRFAPVFLALGIAWLVIANLLLFQNTVTAWRAMIAIAVLSLWYLGFGVVIIVAALVLLLVPATRRNLA